MLEQAVEGKFDLNHAILEASRCLLCHDAPCSVACPAGTDPGKFIRKLYLKNITGAIRTIKENNVLGGVCGALCPAACLCEKKCSATGIDRPIKIGKIQQALIEHAHDTNFKVFKKSKQKPQKIAVIGSGPAGLSCAAALAKDGYKVTVFEKLPTPGGMLRYAIPAYRLSPELLEKELNDILEIGVEIKCSTPIDKAEDFIKKGYDAVFVATGLWESVKLKDSLQDKKQVLSSLAFLTSLRENKPEETIKFIKGKKVAVIGGGSTAIDCVESAIMLEAKDVYLIYRRSYNQMPATDEEKISALKAGAHFMLLTRPVDYVFDAGGKLKQVKLIRTQLGDVDLSGRRTPIDIPNSEFLFDADIVIEAIGQNAGKNSPDLYPSVKVDKNNLIIINEETGQTSVDNIFAGGDISRGPSLIVNAVKDGKLAAKTIAEQLSRKVPQEAAI